jgi:hypothetical protein
MNYMGFCHSDPAVAGEESRIHPNTNVPRSEPEMFRFAQHDKRSVVRFFS